MHRLSALAKLVSGELLNDSSVTIKAVAEIADAEIGDLVFVVDNKNLEEALSSNASAMVAFPSAKISGKPAILVENPRVAMSKILQLFATPCEIEIGVHKSAVVHETAKIGKKVAIGPFVYIGPNVEIGDNTVIYPHVAIYRNTKIGKNCIFHSGAKIGMDGYGFVSVDSKWEKIPQIGNVVIEDYVEIYSNTCVARSTLGSTLIKKGTKIDNLAQVAHNCELGENCAIVSFVGLAGSVKLGNNVSVGGQVGFGGHLEVGDNTVIMARTGVTKNIPANSVVSGFPAMDHRKDMEIMAIIRRLPQILKKLKLK